MNRNKCSIDRIDCNQRSSYICFYLSYMGLVCISLKWVLFYGICKQSSVLVYIGIYSMFRYSLLGWSHMAPTVATRRASSELNRSALKFEVKYERSEEKLLFLAACLKSLWLIKDGASGSHLVGMFRTKYECTQICIYIAEMKKTAFPMVSQVSLTDHKWSHRRAFSELNQNALRFEVIYKRNEEKLLFLWACLHLTW